MIGQQYGLRGGCSANLQCIQLENSKNCLISDTNLLQELHTVPQIAQSTTTPPIISQHRPTITIYKAGGF